MIDEKRTILLGGVGGDSHSVGLTILRQALSAHYNVLYLGPQSNIEDFFQLATICNAVMISCMDGHAIKYLQRVPEFMRQYPCPNVKWYLGGNPFLHGTVGEEEKFRRMGFSRVFSRFVDVRRVFECLAQDLEGTIATSDPLGLWEAMKTRRTGMLKMPTDDVMPESELMERRTAVLASWRTGHEAKNLDENAEFLKDQPWMATAQRKIHENYRGPLMQPRSGVAKVDPQIKLFQAFEQGGANILSYQVDSFTRNNNYIGAEEGIKESRFTGASAINGFPVVNHGVQALRKVAKHLKVPLQTRHSTRSPELLAEISYAGGVSAYEGGSICYNIPYYKDYPVEESIKAWQYVDRLTGLYAERYGIIIDREFFGTLTATLIPPSLAIATGILESLLAAAQGVKCVSIGWAEQGHRVQDIAAIHAIKSLGPEILENMGYTDVQVNSIFHQYMAAFPSEPEKACQLIRASATTATLAGATRILTKTAPESYKIPSMADNLESLQLVQQGFYDASKLTFDAEAVAQEVALIRREVICILEGVFASGRGHLAEGIVKSFANGRLDIPFAPSIHTQGRVMTARDLTGAVRFLDPGNLPFDKELKALHRDLMSDRCHAEGVTMGVDAHLLVERDVLRLPRGEYDKWPLGGTDIKLAGDDRIEHFSAL